MDASGLLQLILLTIAGGGLVYCLIQARGARDICNKMMRDIDRYIKKSEKMSMPIKTKKKVNGFDRAAVFRGGPLSYSIFAPT